MRKITMSPDIDNRCDIESLPQRLPGLGSTLSTMKFPVTARRAAMCASTKGHTVVRSFVTSSPIFCEEVSPYKHGKHRSDAEYLISQVPVIEVAGTVAICDGGSGALGHPLEYIQLNTVSKAPAVCKYCGLRFKMSAGPHHH